jgi:hypothetical protein
MLAWVLPRELVGKYASLTSRLSYFQVSLNYDTLKGSLPKNTENAYNSPSSQGMFFK